jgi:hypothetical protein
MTTQTVKPGTRCECRDENCPGAWDHEAFGGCEHEAVRMVTVGRHYVGGKPPIGYVKDQLPMCAACAQYHEKGGQK